MKAKAALKIDQLPASFHPKDTAELFRQTAKQSVKDHLWYTIHYNQSVTKGDKGGKFKLGKDKYNISDVAVKKASKTAAEKEARLKKMLQQTEAYNHLWIFKLKATQWVLPGFGGAHVSENSLSIHPVYGVPYLPSSSVKGVVRRWYIDALLDGKEEHLNGKQDRKAALGRGLFGTVEQQGLLQFYDILLHDGLAIEKDILTPHFSEYYSEGKAPQDTDKPVPNTFYAVKVGFIWLMITANRRKLNELLHEFHLTAESMKELVSIWVNRAFEELGIGGKTSSGYGRFSDIVDEYASPSQTPVPNKLQNVVEDTAQDVLAHLTPEEQLIDRLEHLTGSERDLEESKKTIYKEVIATRNRQAAALLKQYWEEHRDWSFKKPDNNKQSAKCVEIQKLLDEE